MRDELHDREVGFSVYSRLRSFVYAARGLRFFLASQHNAWLHMVASLIVILVAVALQISREDWRWMALAIALVWVTECLNTAVEQLGDGISLDHNDHVGRAKDVAAGAVLISAAGAAIIGCLTLFPYLLRH